MGLTAEEAANLWPDLVELADEVRACRDEDSAGGKKITRGEIRRLAWKAIRIGVKILGDVLD